MKNRSFLKPLSAILAALTSTGAAAAIQPGQPVQAAAQLAPETVSSQAVGANAPIATGTERVVSYTQGQDLFTFVLARNDDGDFVAQHRSHSSHSSHESHSSHSSHFSSR